MAISLITPPVEEPLSLADLKTFLRMDTSEDDALIAALARAARTHLEAALSQVLITQCWRIIRDCWPKSGRMDLPIGPVRGLKSVHILGPGGWQAVSLALFRLDGHRNPPRLDYAGALPPDPLPTYGGIAIELEAGFGAPAEVPEPLKMAIRMLVAHWYENRNIAVIGHDIARIPHGVEALIEPYRRRRLA